MGLSLPGYRITKQIGVGARSTINLAIEIKTGRRMAVKHVVRDGPEDDRFIEQAETEYNVGSRVDHEYLRKVHQIHRVRKLLAVREVLVVMDYVDGIILEKARPNRLNTFLTVAHRVARGLHAMHQAGFVHSDIKPNNILLGSGGVLKIIDYGQSCPLGHKKERIQGTPDYIAPEQVRRLPLDARTDVYNLGATMYWLLTSENYPTVIQGADPQGAMRITSGTRPLAPIELNEKLPPSLSKLVMECCAENPADRPVDMVQLQARLAVVQKLWHKQREGHKQRRSADASKASGADPQEFGVDEAPTHPGAEPDATGI